MPRFRARYSACKPYTVGNTEFLRKRFQFSFFRTVAGNHNFNVRIFLFKNGRCTYNAVKSFPFHKTRGSHQLMPCRSRFERNFGIFFCRIVVHDGAFILDSVRPNDCVSQIQRRRRDDIGASENESLYSHTNVCSPPAVRISQKFFKMFFSTALLACALPCLVPDEFQHNRNPPEHTDKYCR